MTRILAALVLCVAPLGAQAQSAGAADLLCISVGDARTWTQVALYGGDTHALVIAIPPDGEDAPMESREVIMRELDFAAMATVLRLGFSGLPPAPELDACDEVGLGPVAIALHQPDDAALLYDTPCVTDAVMALNDALIETTGDPSGEPVREWTAPVVPAMRDICRNLP